MANLRVALAQLNLTVGDLTGNFQKILEVLLRAKAWRADLVVVPELAVTGYPPEDLLLKPSFIEDNRRFVHRLAPATRGLTALVGYVDRDARGRLYNAAAVFSDGRVTASYHKQCLPNYGVFDEKRYFTPGRAARLLMVGGVRVGVTICEDLWEEAPCRVLAQAGCRLVVNLSASPYHAGKLAERERLFATRAASNGVAIAYCNLVGGQDELVFDGASLMLDDRGHVVARGAQFEEDLLLADPSRGAGQRTHHAPPLVPMKRTPLAPLEEIYTALALGTRDYVRKNGFDTVVLGLSGGIDSSLVACLAVDALGRDHVVGLVMPSRFSSRATQADARRLAAALGIRCDTISIEPCFTAYLRTLAARFGDRPRDITEQNLQARIRGTLLMALSNKFGWLVLTTGNKSEMATGYCTLYGDMAGGLAVIKDVLKTVVYRLARWRNRQAGPIPPRVFTRAPTAELAPHQTDQDTLPPYAVLDPIVQAYVEEDHSLQEIVRRHRVPPQTIQRVIGMIDRSEYKRRQGPPGVKITPKAFGRDRRMPITNQYH